MVGVMGDVCIYDYVVVVCLVNIDDFMIVDWSCLLSELLVWILIWIINEVKGVNWVCYDISSKLFVIIEWE